MKRLLLLLAVAVAFTFTAVAQTSTPSSDQSSQTSTSTTNKKKSAHSMSAMGEHGTSAKEATLTGCVSAQPDSNGNYTLSNGRYKKGIEVGPTDKIKDHAGHQVKLTGTWSTAAAGETAGGGAAASSGKKTKSFEATDVTMISESCATAPGGGTTSEKPGKSKTKKPASSGF